VDVGICMRPDVLEHKLEAQHEENPEQAWNLARWPNRLSEQSEHRLFVAAGGAWRGYFPTTCHPCRTTTPPQRLATRSKNGHANGLIP